MQYYESEPVRRRIMPDLVIERNPQTGIIEAPREPRRIETAKQVVADMLRREREAWGSLPRWRRVYEAAKLAGVVMTAGAVLYANHYLSSLESSPEQGSANATCISSRSLEAENLSPAIVSELLSSNKHIRSIGVTAAEAVFIQANQGETPVGVSLDVTYSGVVPNGINDEVMTLTNDFGESGYALGVNVTIAQVSPGEQDPDKVYIDSMINCGPLTQQQPGTLTA